MLVSEEIVVECCPQSSDMQIPSRARSVSDSDCSSDLISAILHIEMLSNVSVMILNLLLEIISDLFLFWGQCISVVLGAMHSNWKPHHTYNS